MRMERVDGWRRGCVCVESGNKTLAALMEERGRDGEEERVESHPAEVGAETQRAAHFSILSSRSTMAACTASTRACCTAVAAPTGRRAPPARAAALPAPSGASARRAAAGAGGRSLPPPSATPTARGASSPAASRKMVEDVMTKGVYTVGPDATLDEGERERGQSALSFRRLPSSLRLSRPPSLSSSALQLLVSTRITGLPVVDGEGRVVS